MLQDSERSLDLLVLLRREVERLPKQLRRSSEERTDERFARKGIEEEDQDSNGDLEDGDE